MKTLSAIAVAAFAVIATPAIAAADDAPSASINIGDLDLTTETDRGVLEQRIDMTARRICNSRAFHAEARKLERACRLNVRLDAEPKVQLAIRNAIAGKTRFAAESINVKG